jgi:hypothetical protein
VESDEYRAAVKEPLISIENQARSLALGDAEQEALIIEALSETNESVRLRKVVEVSEGMPDLTKHKLYGLIDKIDAVMAKKEEIHARSLEAKAELDKKKLAERGRETQQEKEARLAASEKVWGNVVKKMPWMVDEDGKVLPEYAEVKTLAADGITAESPIGTQVFAAVAVQLVPKLTNEISSRDAEIKKLRASIKALTGAAPRKGNGSTPKPAPVSNDGKSFASRIDEAFASGKVS